MKTLRSLVLVLALAPLVGCATAYDALRVLVDAAFPPPHDDVQATPRPPEPEPLFPTEAEVIFEVTTRAIA